MKKCFLLGALLALCASAWAQNDPWRDESLPIETRVEDLLGRLTVDEKIDLLRATSPGVPRLGIDKYYHGNEALHGIAYPIVDDDWEVREDDCIKDGIADLVVGKKGETVPLSKLQDVLDLNAEERSGDYSDILVDVERHGISVSNRMQDNPQEELPETIFLEIYRIRNTDTFSIYSYEDGYYIPRRDCHVGKDGKLYQGTKENENENSQYRQIVYQIAEDVNCISWFFNKKNLRVRCLRARYHDESQNDDLSIPDDWHIAIKTLEDDINSEIAQMREEYADDYFHGKRPIV